MTDIVNDNERVMPTLILGDDQTIGDVVNVPPSDAIHQLRADSLVEPKTPSLESVEALQAAFGQAINSFVDSNPGVHLGLVMPTVVDTFLLFPLGWFLASKQGEKFVEAMTSEINTVYEAYSNRPLINTITGEDVSV